MPRELFFQRLAPRWARVLWWFWLVIVVGIVVAGWPERRQDLRQDPYGFAALAETGTLPAEFLPAYSTFCEGIVVILVVGVGLLIYWRKSASWMGLLVSAAMVAIVVAILPTAVALAQHSGRFAAIVMTVRMAGAFLLLLTFYLFPDGRFCPPWTRALAFLFAVLALVVVASGYVPPAAPIDVHTRPDAVILAAMLLFFVLGGISQLIRFRRESNPTRRQQTRWVVAGFISMVVGLVAVSLPPALLPYLSSGGPATVAYLLVAIPGTVLLIVLLPVSFAVAILRYRLWDIDLLIRRTLQWSAITLLLVTLYAACVILLQRIFVSITGQRSQLAIALSTLAIAALFNPLRLRVQRWVDRRYFRARYDPDVVLLRFTLTARDETNVDQLCNEMNRVVSETLQPHTVAVWLREGASDLGGPQGKTG